MAQEKSNIDIKVQKALQKKYEIDGLVGTGGMAVVYKAVQKTLDRTVAIKVVHQNFVHDKEFIDRFIKEARVAASLNHPNIITIHDVDSVDDVHYMTMEYLDGESLSSKIRRKGTLGATETLKIVLPIAKALNYLHKQGFIHRDVKSSNIYVSNDGRPVLMDFGIVFSGESMLSQPGTVLGTPEFMSPEQANGQELSGKSDLYSLGVIMYECLTAQMPFRTDNPLTTVYKVINEAPRPLSSINPTIPEWLNSQVMNLLSKNPEDRVSSGREFAVNLLKKEVVPYNFEGLAVTTYDPPKAKTDDRTRMMGTGGNLAPNVGAVATAKPKSGFSVPQIILWSVNILLLFAIVYFQFFVSVRSNNKAGMVPVIKYEMPVEDVDTDLVYTSVDHMAYFVGGKAGFDNYVVENRSATTAGITGKVLMEVIVETDGKVASPNVLLASNRELENAAVKLLQSIPNFKPAEKSGIPVKAKMVLTIEFK
ncbi:MAG: serine/threonine protein kinase [Cyclobacteriaceae bacterium]|jgi:serine/threonine protein kinase